MKIAVCVKEVPDASAPKRLDPQTFRLDRSVAGALNDFMLAGFAALTSKANELEQRMGDRPD